MKNLWIRFGCFLTGFNYRIVQNSSEVTAKSVKKYTAALLIVCIIWAFVGFTFTQRYLLGSMWASIAGAVIAVIVVIQIERQIILAVHRNIPLYIFRGCLALMMALIGAVIIDQIILKEDIELEKMAFIEKRVDEILPSRTADLKNQTHQIDSTIQVKETERQNIIEDVNNRPLIKSVTTETQSVPMQTSSFDSLGRQITSVQMKPSTRVITSNVANPNQMLIAPLDSLISDLRQQKIQKDNALLNIRPALLEDISSKVGFLDELKVMYSLISKSNVALAFWLLWFLFLLFLELLVLFSKIGDSKTDYDKTILHEMNLRNRQLDLYANAADPKTEFRN